MGYAIYKNMNIFKITAFFWQLVLDGVVDMDVGYKGSDPGSKFFYFTFILHSKVGLKLFFM